MNCYTNYIVIVIYLLCSYFNSTLMSSDVFMFARQQMKALPTHFLVSGIMFDIIMLGYVVIIGHRIMPVIIVTLIKG